MKLKVSIGFIVITIIVSLFLNSTAFAGELPEEKEKEQRTEFRYGLQYTKWVFSQNFTEEIRNSSILKPVSGNLDSSAFLHNYSAGFWGDNYNFMVDYVGGNVIDDEEFQRNLKLFVGLPLMKDLRWFISGTSGEFMWDVENGTINEEIETDYRELKIGVRFKWLSTTTNLGVSYYLLERPGVRKLVAPDYIPGATTHPGTISITTIKAYNLLYESVVGPLYEPDKSGPFFLGGISLGYAEISDSVIGDEISSSYSIQMNAGYKRILLNSRYVDAGLIVGGQFQGQMYGGFKQENGNGHIDHQWSLYSNVQVFF